MSFRARALLTVVLAVGISPLAAPATGAPAPAPVAAPTATPAAADRGTEVVSRTVSFNLTNTGHSLLSCPADNKAYPVRARLVGPRQKVLGYVGSTRMNVLVHDAGTGGWFWSLRQHPAYDYATQLGRQGELSVVLDRLGYDKSPLANGRSTCLDAQAHMLHQVVQHLFSGIYDFTQGGFTPPHASSVVVHGHGTGGAIAQLEAARYDDVAGLVLMSWAGSNASQLAVDQARQQTSACLTGSGYAAYGASRAAFQRLLFASAPAAVRRTATAQRNATPCGDVTSLASTLLSSVLTAGQVEAPVLLMSGSKDARVRRDATQDTAASFRNSEKVTTRVIAGAGSALPLEKSAPRTRAAVLRWLRAL
ncbi:alpha/beta hydrolase [Nocardioides psychrotolerans]|uniref:alpha/beta hydrolase n=1 Tax=Nocardioides psychrotolerans TaxID=1005945 RepID=UPI0031384561